MLTVRELETLALEAIAGPEQGLSVAELHGVTVGIGVTTPDRFELQALVDLIGAEALADGETLARFVGETLTALTAEDLTFAPLLPEDSAPLPERLSALADWCRGFVQGMVAGLAARGLGVDDLTDDAEELYRDLLAIAEVDTRGTEPGEGVEADLVALEEHVKVGAILMTSLLSDAGDHPEE